MIEIKSVEDFVKVLEQNKCSIYALEQTSSAIFFSEEGVITFLFPAALTTAPSDSSSVGTKIATICALFLAGDDSQIPGLATVRETLNDMLDNKQTHH